MPLTLTLGHPIWTLAGIFVGWKCLLLLLACCSPGPGYDTSSGLFLSNNDPHKLSMISHIIEKLTRWDAIYFVKLANRGYMFEQEWAFGWGFSQFIRLCCSALKGAGLPQMPGLEALVAICIAHLAHFLSVLVLYNLTSALFHQAASKSALTASILHIISPAGIFLSAPYAESSCALLTFAGILLFSKGLAASGQTTAKHDLFVLISGVMFGLATTCRSNGILNGLLLLEEAFRTLSSINDGLQASTIRRLVAVGAGGLSVGLGFLLPQYIAYRSFCVRDELSARSWCRGNIPSIYTFVQDYYWNCGPFRYWTLSNLPLFLLAAPMFTILVLSGVWTLRISSNASSIDLRSMANSMHPNAYQVLNNLAVIQSLLVLLTATTAHVQIITRIASAYPVWLWYVSLSLERKDASLLDKVVKFSVVYAVIQAALFASFLPPA